MELKELEEYTASDREKTDYLLEKVKNRSSSISIMDFYPELDWVKHGLYTADLPSRFSALDPRLRSIPIWVTLPYYHVIVVGLEPLKDDQTFQSWYGLTVEHFVDLIKRKKLAVRINNPLRFYAGLNYLDPILEKRPPTIVRNEAYSAALLGQHGVQNFRIDAERTLQNLQVKPLKIAAKWKMSKATFIEASATLYERLCTLGYSDLVRSLRYSLVDPSTFIHNLRLCYLTLAAPCFRSLDGVHALPKDRLTPYHSKIGEQFPVDIGRFLTEKLELVRPKSLGHALDIYPDFEKARKALFKLDEALETLPQKNRVEDRISELEQVWSEVGEMNKNARKKVRFIKRVGIVGTVVSGLASTFVDLPGILASLGFRILGFDEIAQPIGEGIEKIGKSSHIVEVYELKSDVKSWQYGI